MIDDDAEQLFEEYQRQVVLSEHEFKMLLESAKDAKRLDWLILNIPNDELGDVVVQRGAWNLRSIIDEFMERGK